MSRGGTSRDHLFWALLGTAVAARAMVAVGYLEQVWPDEHFQTLEPAASLVWDFGWLAWEWQEGVRSWLVPALYVPVLAACKALGMEGGVAPIIACRLLMVGVSAVFLGCFVVVVRRELRGRPARLFALVLVGFAPAFLVYGAATLSDSWALCLLWAATALVGAGVASPSRAGLFLGAGALLGLGFVVRPQTALWTLGLLACLAGRGATRRRALALVLGVLVPVILHGLLDWLLWGSPFHSTLAYARVHFLEGVASAQGRLPFHAYAALLYQNLGPVPTLAAVFLPVAAAAWRALRVDAARALWLVPAALYLVGHALVPHKEARFLLPIYPALVLLAAAALDGLLAGPLGRLPTTTPWSPRPLAVALVCLLAAWTGLASVHGPEHFEAADLSPLLRRVREDGLLRRQPGACLLLVEHYFVWTRGELLQGHRFRRREQRLAAFLGASPESRRDVAYVVTPGPAVARVGAALGPGFRELQRDGFGNALWRNESLAALPAGTVTPSLPAPSGPVAGGVARAPEPAAAARGGAQPVAGVAPPPGARVIPTEQVPAHVLTGLYEEALRKAPDNAAIRRAYAELCRARGLPCALPQYEWLLRRHPGDGTLRALVEALRRR